MLSLGNRLLKVMAADGDPSEVAHLLDGLLNHVRLHFKDEEAILEQVGYPEGKAHREAHQGLLETADRMRGDFSAGALAPADLLNYFVNQLVREHLFKADAGLRTWLQGRSRG